MKVKEAVFAGSSTRVSERPKQRFPEFAFIGRSNVGKASVINRLLNRKNFARVGATPGKTNQINYFRIDDQLYFTDLPGYGYAKVSKKERARWGQLMDEYFASEDTLTLGFQIVDIRHKPTADDVTMADWFLQTGMPFVVIANKLDKIKKSQLEGNLQTIRTTLHLPEEVPVIPFSAEKGTGREEVLALILEHIEEN